MVSIDRIGRRWLDTMGNIDDLQRRGVWIRSLADNERSWAQYLDADPDSPESFLGYTLASYAAWVSDQELLPISRRTKAGLEKAKADGSKLGAPRRLSEEQEAAVIEMVGSGVSQRRGASTQHPYARVPGCAEVSNCLLLGSQPRNRKGLEAKGRTDGLEPSLRKSVWVIVIWRLTTK